MVAGFADATGRFLPLIATVNAGLVLSAVATLTGTDLEIGNHSFRATGITAVSCQRRRA